MSERERPIEIRELEKTFSGGPFGKGFKALDGVSLEVGRGTVFGLLGPNGAGKTTLIKVLLGLVRGWRGEALLFGRRAGKTRGRRRVGYLPEALRLPGHLSGRQMLELYGMYSGRSRRWLRSRVPGLLDRLGLGAFADRKLHQYSKGMQQRIGLAQALVHEPELVFLDEPTDGVDPIGRTEIRRIVSELRDRGVTVFVNSHLLLEVELVCDRVVIMSHGRIIREGTIEELTPHTGRVAFELGATEVDLERLVSGLGAGFRRSEGGFELNLGAAEQDAVVDRLRAAGVSIRSISALKMTLEDTFVDLLRKEGPR
jgi:ABC-2 type transport system ATP-binding protein